MGLISLREFARRIGIGEKTIRDAIKSGRITQGIVQENGRPKIHYEVALKEIEGTGLGNKIKISTPNQLSKKRPSPVESGQTALDSDMSYSDALKKKENYNALIKELEYKKMEGSLVDKKEIYSQLFDFHQEIRNSLLAIPDRTIDTLLSFGNDRNKAHQLIFESIAKELDKLKILSDEI